MYLIIKMSRVKCFDAEGALGLKLLDALSSTPETSSSAMRDLQSKLDTVSAECLAEKTKVDVKVTHLLFITRFVSFPLLLSL
jgi:hypothetical protein